MTGRHALTQPHSFTAEEALRYREQRLARTFVELADTLVDGFDVMEFLFTLTERCVDLLDVTAVGLMFGDEQGRLRVAASSSEETRLLELSQLQNDEGPCLECYRTGEAVAEPDLSQAEARWPRFAPEAARAGFRTVHALPMRLRDRTVGSLNLFHVEANALSPATTDIAQAMVDVATIGLIQAEGGNRSEVLHLQLQGALDARVVIEQAKGMLAEMEDMSPAQAFTVLRERARRKNVRLIELAGAVVERGPVDLATTMLSPR
jgi:GAF domain-containing protein